MNSLAFAGSIAVNSLEGLELIQDYGPIRILTEVCVPAEEAAQRGKEGESSEKLQLQEALNDPSHKIEAVVEADAVRQDNLTELEKDVEAIS